CGKFLHGVALLRGFSTPSLQAQGEQRLPSYFNIDRDIPHARPPEGFVDRARVSAGVQWHTPNLAATLYPSQSSGTLSRVGGGATVDWQATDAIRFALAGE